MYEQDLAVITIICILILCTCIKTLNTLSKQNVCIGFVWMLPNQVKIII